jgi:hypothetical protein
MAQRQNPRQIPPRITAETSLDRLKNANTQAPVSVQREEQEADIALPDIASKNKKTSAQQTPASAPKERKDRSAVAFTLPPKPLVGATRDEKNTSDIAADVPRVPRPPATLRPISGRAPHAAFGALAGTQQFAPLPPKPPKIGRHKSRVANLKSFSVDEQPVAIDDQERKNTSGAAIRRLLSNPRGRTLLHASMAVQELKEGAMPSHEEFLAKYYPALAGRKGGVKKNALLDSGLGESNAKLTDSQSNLLLAPFGDDPNEAINYVIQYLNAAEEYEQLINKAKAAGKAHVEADLLTDDESAHMYRVAHNLQEIYKFLMKDPMVVKNTVKSALLEFDTVSGNLRSTEYDVRTKVALALNGLQSELEAKKSKIQKAVLEDAADLAAKKAKRRELVQAIITVPLAFFIGPIAGKIVGDGVSILENLSKVAMNALTSATKTKGIASALGMPDISAVADKVAEEEVAPPEEDAKAEEVGGNYFGRDEVLGAYKSELSDYLEQVKTRLADTVNGVHEALSSGATTGIGLVAGKAASRAVRDSSGPKLQDFKSIDSTDVFAARVNEISETFKDVIDSPQWIAEVTEAARLEVVAEHKKTGDICDRRKFEAEIYEKVHVRIKQAIHQFDAELLKLKTKVLGPEGKPEFVSTSVIAPAYSFARSITEGALQATFATPEKAKKFGENPSQAFIDNFSTLLGNLPESGVGPKTLKEIQNSSWYTHQEAKGSDIAPNSQKLNMLGFTDGETLKELKIDPQEAEKRRKLTAIGLTMIFTIFESEAKTIIPELMSPQDKARAILKITELGVKIPEFRFAHAEGPLNRSWLFNAFNSVPGFSKMLDDPAVRKELKNLIDLSSGAQHGLGDPAAELFLSTTKQFKGKEFTESLRVMQIIENDVQQFRVLMERVHSHPKLASYEELLCDGDRGRRNMAREAKLEQEFKENGRSEHGERVLADSKELERWHHSRHQMIDLVPNAAKIPDAELKALIVFKARLGQEDKGGIAFKVDSLMKVESMVDEAEVINRMKQIFASSVLLAGSTDEIRSAKAQIFEKIISERFNQELEMRPPSPTSGVTITQNRRG